MATMIYATLNLETWNLEFARAGHTYPLLCRNDGSTEFLDEAGGPPLGAGLHATYEIQRLTMEPGDTIVLYTDGLIERRGKRLADGEAALREAAAAAPSEPEAKVATILEQLTGGEEVNDDVAILAVHATGLGDSISLELPADPDQLIGIRHILRRWLTAHGATDDDCAAFAIAVTEACANAIQHAYGPEDATLELEAGIEDGAVIVTIRDRGSWRSPRPDQGGRGLGIMRTFMDEVGIDTGDGGTTVELRRHLGSTGR